MARSTASLDQPRYARWVGISHGIDALEPGLDVFVQGLGKLDAQLVYEDAAFQALAPDARASFPKSLELTDRFTLSCLWVLGAYEVIRTLDQRVGERPGVLTRRLAQRVKRTKKAFERVRIPLAKLEPARAHSATDFRLARPAMHRQLGISWRVAERMFVPRRRLSDRLLSLLTAIDEQQSRKARHLTRP